VLDGGHTITFYTATTTVVTQFILDTSLLDGPDVLG